MRTILTFKGIAMAMLMGLLSLAANGQSEPRVVYSTISEGGYIGATLPTLRVDFDQPLQSISWAFEQNDATIASGTLDPVAYTGDMMFNIPVSAQIGSKAAAGALKLRIGQVTLADGTTQASDIALDFNYRSDVPSITKFYPDMKYPQYENYQELKSNTTLYVYFPTDAKMTAATADVYSGGEKVGTLSFTGTGSTTLSAKSTVISQLITNSHLRPGTVTICVTSYTGQMNASSASTTVSGDNLGEVKLEYKGNPAKLTTVSGLEGGLRGWYDPEGSEGLLTMTFDKAIYEGGRARLTFEHADRLNVTEVQLPINVTPGSTKVTVDLRGIDLTIEGLTGKTLTDPTREEFAKATLTVEGLKTADGSGMSYVISDPLGSSTLSYYSNIFDYDENVKNLSNLQSVVAGNSAIVYVDGAQVSYIGSDHSVYVENETASAYIVNADSYIGATGTTQGRIALKALGNGAYAVIPTVASVSVRGIYSGEGTYITTGSSALNVGRYVSYDVYNTNSMAYDPTVEAIVIDGNVKVVDKYGVMPGYDWDVRLASIKGVLSYENGGYVLAPIKAEDVTADSNQEVLLSFGEAKALGENESGRVAFDHAKVTATLQGGYSIESGNVAIMVVCDEQSSVSRGDVVQGIATLTHAGNGVFVIDAAELDAMEVLTSGADTSATVTDMEDIFAGSNYYRIARINGSEYPMTVDADERLIIANGVVVMLNEEDEALSNLDMSLIETIRSIEGMLYPMMGDEGFTPSIIVRDIDDIDVVMMEVLDPNAPAIEYAQVRRGGQFSANLWSNRIDFDREVKEVDYCYIQNDEVVESGTLTTNEESDYRMVEVPVQAVIPALLADGTLSYGDIILRFTRAVMGDDTEMSIRVSHPMTLTETPTVTSIYPAMSYPGKELQELRTNTNLTVMTSATKAVGGQLKVSQNGETLGYIDLISFSATTPGNALKSANLENDVKRLNVEVGEVTIDVVRIDYIDESGISQSVSDESFATVKLMFLGQPGMVTGATGLTGGVKSWYDPAGSDGLLTIHVDKAVADGVTAELEYGTDLQNFVISNLPVSLSADRKDIIVDLRNRMLTIDALTGEMDYIWYNEMGEEIEAPNKIIVNVKNMKTVDGAPINTVYNNGGRTVTLTYWSQAYNYSDTQHTLAQALAAGEGETVLVNADDIKTTFAMGTSAFMEDDSAAAMVMIPEGMVAEGTLHGAIVMKHVEDYLEVYGNNYQISENYGPVNGTLIAKGKTSSKVNYLATYNSSNTESIAYDENYGMVLIDGEHMVIDLFDLVGDFDWTQPITSVTGLIYDSSSMGFGPYYIIPRRASDIMTVNTISLSDALALEADATANIDLNGAVCSAVVEGKAFIQDAEAAIKVEIASGDMAEGYLSGYLSVTALGGGTFEAANTDHAAVIEAQIKGTVIATGTVVDNNFRLVTLNHTNTESLGYDEDYEMVMVDGAVAVVDVFEVLDPAYDWNSYIESVTGVVMTMEGGLTVVAPRSEADINKVKVNTLADAKKTSYNQVIEVSIEAAVVTFVDEAMGGAFLEDDNAGIMFAFEDEVPFNRGDVIRGTVQLMNIGGGMFLVVDECADVEIVGMADKAATTITLGETVDEAMHHRLVRLEHTADAPIVIDPIYKTISINDMLEVDLRYVENNLDLSEIVKINSVTGLLYPTEAMAFDEYDDDFGHAVSGILLIPRTVEDIVIGELSGVGEIESDTTAEGVVEVFNIRGQRINATKVSELTPGIYIVGGVKVLVK